MAIIGCEGAGIGDLEPAMDASVSTFDLIAFDLVAPPVDSATPPDLNAFDLVAAPVDAATPTDLNALDLDQSRAL